MVEFVESALECAREGASEAAGAPGSGGGDVRGVATHGRFDSDGLVDGDLDRAAPGVKSC